MFVDETALLLILLAEAMIRSFVPAEVGNVRSFPEAHLDDVVPRRLVALAAVCEAGCGAARDNRADRPLR
jgi:hypothetical protein